MVFYRMILITSGLCGRQSDIIQLTRGQIDSLSWKVYQYFHFRFVQLRVATGPGKSWKVLEFEKCPGKSWKVLGFVNFFEKSWKSPGILHNVCPMNFLFQVVYNEFSPSCYVRYSTSYFLVYLPVSRFEIYEILQIVF